MLRFISFKAVSVYGAVIFVVRDFDSPAIFLNDTPYLKKVIILLCFLLHAEKLDSLKFSLFFQRANHTELPSEI